MKVLIFLQSATGNTRLVARYATARFRSAGHDCRLHDITARPEPPSLADVDLIGVACPTMYFRQTKAMEQFLARLPRPAGGVGMAFQLATASGEAGCHFSLQGEQLAQHGYVSLGARLVIFPDSWPAHRHHAHAIAGARPLVDAINARLPGFGNLLSLGWPDLWQPTERTRFGLRRFLDDIAQRAAAREIASAPALPTLDHGQPGWSILLGRIITPGIMRRLTDIRLDPIACTQCGTCIKVCPVDCLTRDSDDETPRLGPNCTGCWACYQHCPDDAISGWQAPAGKGRYQGPSAETRALFDGEE